MLAYPVKAISLQYSARHCSCCGRDYVKKGDMLYPDCACAFQAKCPICRECILHCNCIEIDIVQMMPVFA